MGCKRSAGPETRARLPPLHLVFITVLLQNFNNSAQRLSHGAGRGQAKHPASSRKMKTDEGGKQV